MKITIIKHGKTDFNLEGKRQGLTDLSLNEVGRSEVLKLKDRLPTDIDSIVCSPLIRTVETAKILFPDKEVETNDLLLEYDFGELEGTLFSDPIENYPNNPTETYNDVTFLMPNDGESFENIVTRCNNFITFLKSNYNESDHIGIITHSTIMDIIKALAEEKEWSTYLAQAKAFHGFVTVLI